ncbi:hypothetical protein KC340_g1528 [Hortaea werneckii]|nr:hypothetical protein KC342_g9721 [Hortaea werneckii]KAI7108116.1 hypothetical protein KC339_g1804 [Hortaea werneckii]KAI7230069.1 hypothetical protein KC365_g7770 [Hortaea werneckii]KAI7336813.1 hypothetical protein KC340_g1528 [Hortaea werneckii]KAI7402612.1 hypothetical protein KC328_g2700 [Hortaea werneckii]
MAAEFAYSGDELRRIGARCANRLPPASALQQMFEYELKRGAETEKLFHHTLLNLHEQNSTTKNHEERLQKLEFQLDAMGKQLKVSEIDERLNTNKIRIRVQQTKMDEMESKLQQHGQTLKQLADDVTQKLDASKPTAEYAGFSEQLAGVKGDLNSINSDVNTLFGERDALINMIEDNNDYIKRLEDLVRNLTLQLSTSWNPSSGSTPAMTHRVPFKNTAGVDLEVPKGSGFATGRENRAPPKTFTPGKPWM